MTNLMYADGDFDRPAEVLDKQDAEYRPPVMRDYGRIIHSASFRRQQGKTQVFPGHESDFFRNRLTHSLEVSQIAEGIADRINYTLLGTGSGYQVDPRLCAVAGLVHDIGHPPFGHNGERALDAKMIEYGGFEGNAQTFRILARLEKKVFYPSEVGGDTRAGMNLCNRTLASILKYDKEIAHKRGQGDKVQKGYYGSERPIVDGIKKKVLRGHVLDGDMTFKTIECQVMDLADDFAYSVYDLEDSLKAGFLTPAGILASSQDLLEKVAAKVAEELEEECTPADVQEVFAEVFEVPIGTLPTNEVEARVAFTKVYESYERLGRDSYYRTRLSSELVHGFIAGVNFELNERIPALSKAWIEGPLRRKVEVLKQYTYVAMIYSSRVKLGEYRGLELVSDIFDALVGPKGDLLMPDDVRKRYTSIPSKTDEDKAKRARVVCDFVAGMTDRYAMEFWARLKSDAAQSMFKPI